MSIMQEKFKAIADKIREKLGTTDLIKPNDFVNKIDKVYEAGKKIEYNEHWNTYLANTTHTMSLFSGYGWTDKTFKPNKNIVLTGYSVYTFYYSQITDLVKLLHDSKVTLSVGKCTTLQALYGYSKVTTSPYLDLTEVDSYNNIFANATNLKTIEGIKVKEDKVFSYTFGNCPKLEHILVEGTIGQNGFDISSSKNLDAESLYSIIVALSKTTTGLTIKLPSTAEANYNANPPEDAPSTWAELIASRSNWTIAYA